MERLAVLMERLAVLMDRLVAGPMVTGRKRLAQLMVQEQVLLVIE